MSKEEYYIKIKRFVYRKLDEMEVFKVNNGVDLSLRYKNSEFGQIYIDNESNWVVYKKKFGEKFTKIIGLEKRDFEILLKSWVEETFQMKVREIFRS